jgi:hypothetical protein
MGREEMTLPSCHDHQSPEENNMHRQAAVSSKLTRCEENSSAGQVASDREVPTVHLFWYKYKERQIIHASQVSVKDGSPTVCLFREEVSQQRNHLIIIAERERTESRSKQTFQKP